MSDEEKRNLNHAISHLESGGFIHDPDVLPFGKSVAKWLREHHDIKYPKSVKAQAIDTRAVHKANGTEIPRKHIANQLSEIMEPHCKTFEEVKVIEAAILALFSTISPAVVVRELRQIIGDKPGA